MQIKTNQKGITLTSLVAYMSILMIVIAAMTTMSTFFFSNVSGVVDTPKYLSEFNKFTMFFVTDIKNYTAANVTSNTIEFEGGPTYRYQGNAIYRNDVKIAEYIMSCNFTLSQYNVDKTSKNIINVDMQIGKNAEKSVQENVDFVLKYW